MCFPGRIPLHGISFRIKCSSVGWGCFTGITQSEAHQFVLALRHLWCDITCTSLEEKLYGWFPLESHMFFSRVGKLHWYLTQRETHQFILALLYQWGYFTCASMYCGQLWVRHMFCCRTCDGLYHFTFYWSFWDTFRIPTDQVCPSRTLRCPGACDFPP